MWDLLEVLDLIGEPWLSAGLVKIGNPVYLVKWESADPQPTLHHIPSIASLEVLGINEGNYGRYVLNQAEWEARYGFKVDTLARYLLPPTGYEITRQAHGWRLVVLGLYRGYSLPAPYDSWTAADTELVAVRVRIENVSGVKTSFARRDLRLLYDARGQMDRPPVRVLDTLKSLQPWWAEEIPEGGGQGEFPPGKSVEGMVTFPGRPEYKPLYLLLMLGDAQQVIVPIASFPVSPIPQ